MKIVCVINKISNPYTNSAFTYNEETAGTQRHFNTNIKLTAIFEIFEPLATTTQLIIFMVSILRANPLLPQV